MPQRVIQSFEELRSLAGQEIAAGDWFTLTQSRIDAFAEATEDRQWIHLDAQRAHEQLPGGKTIAHGFLTLSLVAFLLEQAVKLEAGFSQAINYGLNRVRFPHPVPAGSEIRLRCTLSSIEDVPGGVQVGWNLSLEVKDVSKPALVAEWLMRYYH